MRYLAITLFLVVAVATVADSASFSMGTIKTLGGGSDTVAHCQVLDYSVAASDTISSVDAQVVCTKGGSYNVTATVTSPGASTGTGQQSATLTADAPQSVTVAISPSVLIGSSTYDADVQVIN